jgi:hypothetical protein
MLKTKTTGGKNKNMAIQFDWTEESIQHTLGMRDRFTKAAIRQDFEADPKRNCVKIDAEHNLYATNVFDNRYAVVWQFDAAQSLVKVKFAVAAQFREESPEALREKMAKLVIFETDNRFTLLS